MKGKKNDDRKIEKGNFPKKNISLPGSKVLSVLSKRALVENDERTFDLSIRVSTPRFGKGHGYAQALRAGPKALSALCAVKKARVFQRPAVFPHACFIGTGGIRTFEICARRDGLRMY